jgi:hypothetical protein
MKKSLIIMVLVLGLGVAGIASAGYWGNMMGSGYGNGGPMMGPGFRGNGGPGSGMPCWDNNYGASQGQRTLSKQDAEAVVTNYIGGNPNLKAGKIEDKTTYFETEIRTKDNSLVSKLAIDKNTGYVRPLY